MPEVNFEWVKSQLEEGKVSVAAGAIVLDLLKTWNKAKDVPDAVAGEVRDIFNKLSAGTALINSSDEVWTQSAPGAVQVGSEVRIHPDAFPASNPNFVLNGRTGRILSMRRNQIVFRSTDDKIPFIDDSYVPTEKTQYRIR